MYRLAPCQGCHRHVRVAEEACPFCGTPSRDRGPSSLASGVTQVPGASRRRLKRAALFALGASINAAACGQGETERGQEPPPTASTSAPGPAASSSAPGPTATTPADEVDAGGGGAVPEPTAVALYGAIPTPVDVSAGGAPGEAEPLPQAIYGAPVAPP